MNLRLRIDIRLYFTHVELERFNTICIIYESPSKSAFLKTRENIRGYGWKTTNREEFKGTKTEAFNNAYRAAIQKLSTANHTEESKVVEHFLDKSPDW